MIEPIVALDLPVPAHVSVVRREMQIDNLTRKMVEGVRAVRNDDLKDNPLFRKACELAEIEPTKRQRSKWNNNYGAAWARRFDARRALSEEATHG